MKKWAVAILVSWLFTGCEKKIDFELNDSEQKLVVEATIENDEAPVVVLTRSVGYFSVLNPQTLLQNFVHNAEVYVSNGTLTHKLKEYQVPLGGNISLFYYSTDSSDLATAFTGELMKQYSLLVKSEGNTYTAVTSIPDTTKKIDSLWWKPVPFNADSTRAIIMVRATDPPGYGDYIRYYTRINEQPFFPPWNSVFDDYFVDGTTYEISLEPGVDRNDLFENPEFFYRGDTITFKLSNIDKTTYDFWRTWEFAFSSIGNPFSTPTKVLGNISNGALGYFAGYASRYRTLIIPQ
ncbi:MAG TPA: DUF4249 domain-containing protein [Flavisolibacter sp.]